MVTPNHELMLWTIATVGAIVFASVEATAQAWVYWGSLVVFVACILLYQHFIKKWFVPRKQHETQEEIKSVSWNHLGDELEKAFEDAHPRLGVDVYVAMRKAALDVIKREM